MRPIIAAIETRNAEEADRLAAAHGEQVVAQVHKLLAGDPRLSLAL